MPAESIAIARASYEAYVSKDRAAIEALIAPGFHFTSPLDNRIDRATYFSAAGRTAAPSKASSSSTCSKRTVACSRPTSAATATTTGSRTPRS